MFHEESSMNVCGLRAPTLLLNPIKLAPHNVAIKVLQLFMYPQGNKTVELANFLCKSDLRAAAYNAKALRKEPLTVYGDGKQTESFQYVYDLKELDQSFHSSLPVDSALLMKSSLALVNFYKALVVTFYQ